MPLIRRKLTLLGSIGTIILTPFIFLLVGAYLNWWKLLICICVLFFVVLLNRESLKNLIPGKEQLMIWGGIICFLMFVATLLTIKDYFETGGYETVWEPDECCIDAVRLYAEKIVSSEFTGLYDNFSQALKSEATLDQFVQSINHFTSIAGKLTEVKDILETEIYPHEYKDSPIDAVVQVFFYQNASRGEAIIEFHLNCKDSYQVVNYQFLQSA